MKAGMEIEIGQAALMVGDILILKPYIELYRLLLDNGDGILMENEGWWNGLMKFSSKASC